MTARQKVLFHVQHLLGTGHLHRIAAIAHALSSRHHEVWVLSGGLAVPSLDTSSLNFVQLAPASSADSRFSALVGEHGETVDDKWREDRFEQIRSVVEAVQPDAVVTETYPFGRGLVRAEIEATLTLIEQRFPQCLRICSFRDILEPRSKPDRYEAMLRRAQRWFDAIVIHADPNFVDFGETFPLAESLSDRIYYSGFVGPNITEISTLHDQSERFDIIVSAGGGRVGLKLLQTAIDAHALSRHSHLKWLVLAGSQVEAADFDALQRAAAEAPNTAVSVQRNRPDFRSLLANAAVSVSQAGYNTVIDILSARIAAVLIPYAADGAKEQSLRASSLAAKGLALCIEEAELTPALLAEAVEKAGDNNRLKTTLEAASIMLDGAARSAEIIESLIQARRST